MWDNERIAEYYDNEIKRLREMRERQQQNYELEDNNIQYQEEKEN